MSNDLLKCAGGVGLNVLTNIFLKIVCEEQIPISWQDSFTIPLYKGKGGALECSKHRGLYIVKYGIKIWEECCMVDSRKEEKLVIISLVLWQVGLLQIQYLL